MKDLPDSSLVRSREDLIEYLRELSSGARCGEYASVNLNSADLLGSAAQWMLDKARYLESRGEHVSSEATWSYFAEVLSAALVYE